MLRFWQKFLNRRREREAYRARIDLVVDEIEPKIRWVRGYRKRLLLPVQTCYRHCESIVASIPGPIFLGEGSFADHPLIRAAFTGDASFQELLAGSDTESTVSSSPGSRKFALLTMKMEERSGLGYRKEGELLVGDSRLTSVTFSDHKLIGLADSETGSRQRLAELIFEVIIELAAQLFEHRRNNIHELQEQKARLQAMASIYSRQKKASRILGAYQPVDTERLEKIDTMLQEVARDLQPLHGGYEQPADWLEVVRVTLLSPHLLLSSSQRTVRIDWRNVLTANPEEDAQTFTFAQCSLSSHETREAVLISF